MKTDSLALRTAKTFVDSYTREEEVLEQHRQAIDCRECEAFLQLGIDAFDWIIRADQLIRQEMFEGRASFDHSEAEDAIRALCKAWLKPCDRANQWVALQQSRNFRVENLEEFHRCCVEMLSIVAVQDTTDEDLPDAMAQLRDRAVEEFKNGQTAEFI